MKLIKFRQITSTQDLALGMIQNNEIVKNTIITSEIQTAGRGRIHNRSWVTEKGSFAGTYIFNTQQFPIILEYNNNIGYYISQAIVHSLRQIPGGEMIYQKPPNDIYWNGYKLGGILVEYYPPFILIGVGLNITCEPLDTSKSLRSVMGRNIEILGSLDTWLYEVIIKYLTYDTSANTSQRPNPHSAQAVEVW